MNQEQSIQPLYGEAESDHKGYESAVRNNRMYLGIISVFLVCLLLLILALIFQIKSKSVVPIPVIIDSYQGTVHTVDADISTISWDTVRLMDEFFIFQFALAMERYTPELIQTDYELALNFICNDQLLSEYQSKVDLDNPDNYFDIYGNHTTVIPDIGAINYLRSSADLADSAKPILEQRYYTINFDRNITRISSNTNTVRYQSTIGISNIERAVSVEKRRKNPLGYCVYSYNRTSLTAGAES